MRGLRQCIGLLGWALLFSIGGVEAKVSIACHILPCFGSKVLCPAKGGCCNDGRTYGYRGKEQNKEVDLCKTFAAVEWGSPKCICQHYDVGNCGWYQLKQPDGSIWMPAGKENWKTPPHTNPSRCAMLQGSGIEGVYGPFRIDSRPAEDCRCPAGYVLPVSVNPNDHIGWKTFDCDIAPCHVAGSMVEDAVCRCNPGFSGSITWDSTSMGWTGNCQMTCKSLQDHEAKCSLGLIRKDDSDRTLVTNSGYFGSTCCQMTCKSLQDHEAKCSLGRIRKDDSDRTLVTSSGDFESTCCQMTCKSFQDNVNCPSGHTRKADSDSIVVTGSGDFEPTCCERILCRIANSNVENAICRCTPGFSGSITWDSTSRSWTGNCQMTCKSLQDHEAKCSPGRIRKNDSDRALVTSTAHFESTCCQMTCLSLQNHEAKCSPGRIRKDDSDRALVTSSGEFESTCCQMTCKSLQDHGAKCSFGRIRKNDSDRTLVTSSGDFESTCCQMTCKSFQVNVNCPSGHTRKADSDSIVVTSSGDFEPTCCEPSWWWPISPQGSAPHSNGTTGGPGGPGGPGGDTRATMHKIIMALLASVCVSLLIKSHFAPDGGMKYLVASAVIALVWLALSWCPVEAIPELMGRLGEKLIDKLLSALPPAAAP